MSWCQETEGGPSPSNPKVGWQGPFTPFGYHETPDYCLQQQPDISFNSLGDLGDDGMGSSVLTEVLINTRIMRLLD